MKEELIELWRGCWTLPSEVMHVTYIRAGEISNMIGAVSLKPTIVVKARSGLFFTGTVDDEATAQRAVKQVAAHVNEVLNKGTS